MKTKVNNIYLAGGLALCSMGQQVGGCAMIPACTWHTNTCRSPGHVLSPSRFGGQTSMHVQQLLKPATSPTLPAASSDLSSSREANHAKKLNVVLYDVQECPSGMSRSARQDSDLSSIVSALSPIDPTIQSSDCFRLGKCSQSSRQRPILIRFFRVADANRILTKRYNLSHPFSLKPDLPFQRVQNSLLLKQR